MMPNKYFVNPPSSVHTNMFGKWMNIQKLTTSAEILMKLTY